MSTIPPPRVVTDSTRKPRFWDNLVPLKPGLFGEQTAGWKPGPPALTGLGCTLLADQMIPVDPGVSLASDVYIPKTPGRYPVVLSFAAYTKELHTTGFPAGTNEVGSPPVFTDRGYVHVIVSGRGMGRSGGQRQMFFGEDEVHDIEKVLAWASREPWSDGSVVMFGTSYYACVQPLLAVRKPPQLKAFFCIEMCTDFYRQIARFGGVPGLYFLSTWLGANFSEKIIGLRVPPLLRALLSHLFNNPSLHARWWPHFQKHIPALMRAVSRQTPTREVRDIWVNWMVDGKTRQTHTIPPGPHAELGNIDIPFVTVQNLGQLSLHQFGSYELFEKASTPADHKWLIMGPPSYRLPVYEWQEEALAFFDHTLRGTPNGYAEQPRVRYWSDGDDRFLPAASFPIPGSRPVRLFPVSQGSGREVNALSPTPPEGGTDQWVAIPLGAPTIGGLESTINQTLTYEMVVTEEIRLAGPVTANLSFSCNEIDSFVMARLSRVDTLGGLHPLSYGVIAPSRRKIDATRGSATEIALDTDHPEPLQPGEPVVLRFSLTPGPARITPGEKLRLDIASRTDLLMNDMAHHRTHFPLQVPPYFSRNTLHLGPETYVEVTI